MEITFLQLEMPKAPRNCFDSFAMFYCINDRLPYTTVHLFVFDREIAPGIEGGN